MITPTVCLYYVLSNDTVYYNLTACVTYMCVYIYIYIYMSRERKVCARGLGRIVGRIVGGRICTYIQHYICVYIYIYIYTYTNTCVCICVYIYIYIYVYDSFIF